MYECITRLLPTLDNIQKPVKECTRRDENGLPVVSITTGMFQNWFLNDLGISLDTFEKEYPEHYPERFQEVLARAGVELSSGAIINADVSAMDGCTVLALILGIYEVDRMIRENNRKSFENPEIEYNWDEDPLLDIFRHFAIDRWIRRLKEMDEETIHG